MQFALDILARMRGLTTSVRLAGSVIWLAMNVVGCSAAVDTPISHSETNTGSAEIGQKDSGMTRVEKPSLHSGDVWVDRIQGEDREFRIEEIHDGLMQVSFWGAEMATDDAFNILVFRSLTQSSSEPITSDKPGIWFAFPLYPGKNWSNKYDWELLGAAPVKGKAEDHGFVLGWEDVTVPAGTFHSLKVVVSSRYFGAGGYNDDSTLTYWYTPEINRFVRFDYRDTFDGALLAELVAYKPGTQPN